MTIDEAVGRLRLANEVDGLICSHLSPLDAEALRLVLADRERLQKKCDNSLANNLCPDHRDKQAGKPCLACEVERLTEENEALEATLEDEEVGSLDTLRLWQEAKTEVERLKAELDGAYGMGPDAKLEIQRLRAEVERLRELCRRSHGVVHRRLDGCVEIDVREMESLERDLLRAVTNPKITDAFCQAADIEASTPITGGAAAHDAQSQEFLDRAEAAEEVLRSLASYLSVGGYNAPAVDAEAFGRKIRAGIDLLLRPLQAEVERLRGGG